MILGQSGCGKTTLLRLTGGLESADSGEVLWGGAHKTAFVFQERGSCHGSMSGTILFSV